MTVGVVLYFQCVFVRLFTQDRDACLGRGTCSSWRRVKLFYIKCHVFIKTIFYMFCCIIYCTDKGVTFFFFLSKVTTIAFITVSLFTRSNTRTLAWQVNLFYTLCWFIYVHDYRAFPVHYVQKNNNFSVKCSNAFFFSWSFSTLCIHTAKCDTWNVMPQIHLYWLQQTLHVVFVQLYFIGTSTT